MVRLCAHSLLVLRCLQRRNMGIRCLYSRYRLVIQRRARDRRDGLCDRQCGDQSERGDGGAISCAISSAGEGGLGILGELWYDIMVVGGNRSE